MLIPAIVVGAALVTGVSYKVWKYIQSKRAAAHKKELLTQLKKVKKDPEHAHVYKAAISRLIKQALLNAKDKTKLQALLNAGDYAECIRFIK